MKKRALCTAFLSFITCIFIYSIAGAGSLADQKLLDILEKKGLLTRQEAASVKSLLTEEEKNASEEKEKEIEVVYEDGLEIRTKDKKTFSARIGGRIQTDLTVFDNHYPVDNDFDIRRARLFMEGRIYEYFKYKIAVELEGSSSNRLVDAFVNFDYFPYLQFQVGQFKEPFSLEALSSSKYIPFNERSFASYLSPGRDVGVMLHGELFNEAIQYAAGIFNGDGRDAENRGQKDDKEITGRLLLKPFSHVGPGFLKNLHLGGSYSYARLDTSDFSLKVRTPARTSFYTVKARAKFHITQEVDYVQRYGAELAYALGPMLITAEYVKNKFCDVKLSDTEPFDFDLRAWYVSVLFMLTGEKPEVKGGVIQKIRPKNDFNPAAGTWGAWGIGVRYQKFEAGRVVYQSLVNMGESVRRVSSFTVAVNWYLNRFMRISLNYSRTSFDDPMYLGNHWKGYSYYEDTENAWVTRFQFEF